jgi:anti-anti-sigma factor
MPFNRLVEIEATAQGTTQLVRVRGEIDISSVCQVRDAIDTALGLRPETLLLDLSEIAFCDSSGIHLVVSSHRHAVDLGIRLVVVRPVGPAWRAFELCQIDREVRFVSSLDGASPNGRPSDGGAPDDREPSPARATY